MFLTQEQRKQLKVGDKLYCALPPSSIPCNITVGKTYTVTKVDEDNDPWVMNDEGKETYEAVINNWCCFALNPVLRNDSDRHPLAEFIIAHSLGLVVETRFQGKNSIWQPVKYTSQILKNHKSYGWKYRIARQNPFTPTQIEMQSIENEVEKLEDRLKKLKKEVVE